MPRRQVHTVKIKLRNLMPHDTREDMEKWVARRVEWAFGGWRQHVSVRMKRSSRP